MSTAIDSPATLKNRKPEPPGAEDDSDDDHDTPQLTTKRERRPSSSHDGDGDGEEAVTFGVLDVLRVLLGLLVLSCSLSFFVTGESIAWGYRPEWSKWKNLRALWLQTKPIYLTDDELARYDGSNDELPIYLSINNTIFDVTAGRSRYGPGGGYSFFAGRDASRAYVTGCFKDDLTWDMRGVEDMFEGDHEDPKEAVRKSLDKWLQFFVKHEKYFFVGYTVHQEGWEERTPIRDLCEAVGGNAKRQQRIERERREREAEAANKGGN